MRLFLAIMLTCFAGLVSGADDGIAREAAKRGAAAIRAYLDEPGVVMSKNTDPALYDLLRALDKVAKGSAAAKGVEAPPPAGGEKSANKPTADLFRKALKTQNLQYDAATNKLSIGYDFKSTDQLQDWEFSEKPELKGGVLIPVGATATMKARFAAAKVSVLYTPSTVRGCVYTTTSGLFLSRKTSSELSIGKGDGEHPTPSSYSIPGEIGALNLDAASTISRNGQTNVVVRDGAFMMDKRLTLELDAQGRFALTVTDPAGKLIGKTLVSSEEKLLGGLVLTGQNTGAGQRYREVIVVGTPDPAWVESLFDALISGKTSPSLKSK